jgi:hypothetical protein
MTSWFRSIGIAGGILVLAGVQNASAQLADTVEFTTSFPFTVGYATVPAGTYTVRPDDDNPRILELKGGHTAVLFQTDIVEEDNAPSKTEVVFKRYGDGYVLKDLWVEGSRSGAESTAVESEHHASKHGGETGEERVAGHKKSRNSNDH